VLHWFRGLQVSLVSPYVRQKVFVSLKMNSR
jgi:hypothetical protein